MTHAVGTSWVTKYLALDITQTLAEADIGQKVVRSQPIGLILGGGPDGSWLPKGPSKEQMSREGLTLLAVTPNELTLEFCYSEIKKKNDGRWITEKYFMEHIRPIQENRNEPKSPTDSHNQDISTLNIQLISSKKTHHHVSLPKLLLLSSVIVWVGFQVKNSLKSYT